MTATIKQAKPKGQTVTVPLPVCPNCLRAGKRSQQEGVVNNYCVGIIGEHHSKTKMVNVDFSGQLPNG
jgi:hypothetical protein